MGCPSRGPRLNSWSVRSSLASPQIGRAAPSKLYCRGGPFGFNGLGLGSLGEDLGSPAPPASGLAYFRRRADQPFHRGTHGSRISEMIGRRLSRHGTRCFLRSCFAPGSYFTCIRRQPTGKCARHYKVEFGFLGRVDIARRETRQGCHSTFRKLGGGFEMRAPRIDSLGNLFWSLDKAALYEGVLS